MTTQEIMTFFKLEENPILFNSAIKPPSCGGSEEFKFMALLGDSLLNFCLNDFLSEKYKTKVTGQLTKLNNRFHNKLTLGELSRKIVIPDIMKPIDKNYKISQKDAKETIESLIFASFEINGLDYCKEIIIELYEKAVGLNILFYDYKSVLKNYCDKFRISDPNYKCKNVGFENKTEYECVLTLNLNKEIKTTSLKFGNTDEAEQDAAFRMLHKLGFNFDENHDDF